jgi:ppGpp synthetase/RelA/SpoT-type nucleotidyltranferase
MPAQAKKSLGQNIDAVVKKYVEEERSAYNLLAEKTHELLSSILKAKGIVPHSITFRVKSPVSLKKKILRETKNYDDPISDITDLAGVRVITYFPSDVDKISAIIHEEFAVDPERSVDKRKTVDASVFGYASVHLVVEFLPRRLELPEYALFRGKKCEIQVRTILQHSWAEIEHDIVYKSSEDIPFELRRRFASLAGLLEMADREFESLRRDEIKVRKAIETRIEKENINIPVDLDSLRFYLQKYHKQTDIDPRMASSFIKVLKYKNVSSIEQLDDILSDQALAKADERLLKKDFRCSQKKKVECLLRYFLAVGEHFNIGPDELFGFSTCRALYESERQKDAVKKYGPRSRKNAEK